MGKKYSDVWESFGRVETNYGWQSAISNIFELSEDKKKFYDSLNQYIITYILNYYMEGCRRVWIRPSGDGSQDSETNLQELTAKLIVDAAAKVKTYWEDME